MTVDPCNKDNFNKTLWCIYGHKSFPSIVCCKIKPSEYGPIIWGYSVWKGVPGFRTIGQNVSTWMQEHKDRFGYKLFEFYDSHEEAMWRISKLTTPKV